MDNSALKAKIIAAWAERYPDDQKPIETTEIVDKAFGGSLAAIKSKEKDGKIFYNTDEMGALLRA